MQYSGQKSIFCRAELYSEACYGLNHARFGKPCVADFDGPLARLNKAKAPNFRLATRRESYPGPEPEIACECLQLSCNSCGEAEYAVGRFVLEHAGALGLSRSGWCEGSATETSMPAIGRSLTYSFYRARLADALEVERLGEAVLGTEHGDTRLTGCSLGGVRE